MKKKIVINIVFTSISLIFLFFSFNLNNSMSNIYTEVRFTNEPPQFTSEMEIRNKIYFYDENIERLNNLNDINTRLLEDSIESLNYVKNAEVYLSKDKLTILIQEEQPFIKTTVNNETYYLSEEGKRLNLVEGRSREVLYFICNKRIKNWDKVIQLADFIYSNDFLSSFVSKVIIRKNADFILYSDFFETNINIGDLHKLNKKIELIKLFFSEIDKSNALMKNKLIKELNVKYENQIICIK